VSYLLDTHAFIWFDAEPHKLSNRAVQIMCSTEPLYLSVVSIWEMAIKSQTGKLTLRSDIDRIVSEQVEKNGLKILDVTLPHSLSMLSLPAIHKDPFDRLLIAQARTEKLVMLTVDPDVRKYPIQTDW
jgi:PIN domain nuclease of toxin-antitoxin system